MLQEKKKEIIYVISFLRRHKFLWALNPVLDPQLYHMFFQKIFKNKHSRNFSSTSSIKFERSHSVVVNGDMKINRRYFDSLFSYICYSFKFLFILRLSQLPGCKRLVKKDVSHTGSFLYHFLSLPIKISKSFPFCMHFVFTYGRWEKIRP